MSIAKDLLIPAVLLLSLVPLLTISGWEAVYAVFLPTCLFVLLTYIKKYIFLKQEILQQREYFIKILSHDLRVSTLAQLRGLDLLKNDGAQGELVNNIKDSCKYTLDMITMLLNTYRFENGEQVLNYEKFKLSDLILNIGEGFSKSAAEKGINISYSIRSTGLLEADRESVSKLAACLISTSILNSNCNSSIDIQLSKICGNFEVIVKYTGIPLSDEECRRMFSSGTRFSTVGHGIRMNLCKKIVDFHGGNIRVINNDGKINAFTFILPAKRKSVSIKNPVFSTL